MSVTRASGGTANVPSGKVGAGAAGFEVSELGCVGTDEPEGANPFGNSCGWASTGEDSTIAAQKSPAIALTLRALEPMRNAYFFFVPKSTVGGLLIAPSSATENCGFGEAPVSILPRKFCSKAIVVLYCATASM